MKEKDIKFEDVVVWISSNHDRTPWMDALNSMTFPYTSKYKVWKNGGDDAPLI